MPQIAACTASQHCGRSAITLHTGCTDQFVLEDQLKLVAHDVQALRGNQQFCCGVVMHMNVSEDDDRWLLFSTVASGLQTQL